MIETDYILKKWKAAILLPAIMMTGIKTFAQDQQYKDECKLLHDLFAAANLGFFDFTKQNRNDTIILLDEGSALSHCALDSIGFIKVLVVTESPEISIIKTESIFDLPHRRELFVITKNKRKDQIWYGIYYPKENSQYAWIFKRRKRLIILKRKAWVSFNHIDIKN